MAWITVLLCLVTYRAMAADDNFAKGWDLLKQKQYQEARTAFEAGLQDNPANAMAHFYLADACRGLEDWACAEEHYETSIDLDAKSSVVELAKQPSKKQRSGGCWTRPRR